MAHIFEKKNPRLYIAALTIEDMLLVREYATADKMRDEWVRIKAQVPDLRNFDPDYWHHRECESIAWDRFATNMELDRAIHNFKKAELKQGTSLLPDLVRIALNYVGSDDTSDEATT